MVTREKYNEISFLLRYFVSFLDIRSIENLRTFIASRELVHAILLKILTFRSSFNVLLEERIYSKLRNRIHFSLWILPRVESRQEVIQGRVHSNTYRINPDDEEGEE